MLAGYKGNRHSRLASFGNGCQFLLHRISAPALYAGKDFHSISCVKHRRITRLSVMDSPFTFLHR